MRHSLLIYKPKAVTDACQTHQYDARMVSNVARSPIRQMAVGGAARADLMLTLTLDGLNTHNAYTGSYNTIQSQGKRGKIEENRRFVKNRFTEPNP